MLAQVIFSGRGQSRGPKSRAQCGGPHVGRQYRRRRASTPRGLGPRPARRKIIARPHTSASTAGVSAGLVNAERFRRGGASGKRESTILEIAELVVLAEILRGRSRCVGAKFMRERTATEDLRGWLRLGAYVGSVRNDVQLLRLRVLSISCKMVITQKRITDYE